MSNAKRDGNFVTTIQGVSSLDLATPTDIATNPVTHAVLIDSTSLYSGLDSRYLKLTADNAIVNTTINGLLPSQTSNSGKYLTTDGSNTSWATVSAGTPGGSTTQIQYNNAGAFGGISGFTYDGTTLISTLPETITIATATTNGLVIKSSDDNNTNSLLKLTDSTGTTIFSVAGAANTQQMVYTSSLNDTNYAGAQWSFNTSGSGSVGVTGWTVQVNSGYTGSGDTTGLNLSNFARSSDATTTGGAVGLFTQCTGAAAGTRTGLQARASGSSANNIGAFGWAIAAGSGNNIGLWGAATNTSSGLKVGGYFSLINSTAPNISGALVANNVAVATNIFVAQDNGTAVFTIADGGTTTLAVPTATQAGLILQTTDDSAVNPPFQIQNSTGTAIITMRTVATNNTTRNFLNITGTLGVAGAARGVNISITGVPGTNTTQNAVVVTMNAGYTGAGSTVAMNFANFTAGTGTGWNVANFGINGSSFGSGTGNNIGGNMQSANGLGRNIGSTMIGDATGSTGDGIGLISSAIQGTGQVIGGYFTLVSAFPASISGALIANNATVAVDIFGGYDNGTKVWSVADGGHTTWGEAVNMVFGTTTGTQIGTGTTQKLAHYGATPIVQPANTVAIDDVLVNLGLRATGGKADFTASVRLTDKITTYNNVVTEGYGVGAIVDDVALTNQGADITTTNFTNAQTAGTYQISYTLEDTTADLSAGAVTLTIAWTDGAGATTVTANQVLTGTGRASGVIHVQLASGNLTYAVAHTGLFGSAKYALFMSCIRLS